MQNFNVLVTGQHLVPEAQRILQDAGAQLRFMAEPIDEQALIDCLTAHPIEVLLVRGPKPITARVLAVAPDLEIIAKNGAGVDSIDLQEAARRDICVAVAPGANAYAVAEHTLAMMLALVRDLAGHDRRVRNGGWEGSAYQGRDFAGSVVGIVGFGSIGRHVAKMAEAFGARVLIFGRAGKSEQFPSEPCFDTFLSKVDILSLHCPLTNETRGLIGAREMGLMKPGSFIVNTARGGLIDEHALAAALSEGHLAGAGLDTLGVEPMDPTSPLLHVDNVMVTPHIAGVTRHAALAVATTTANNIVDYMQGRALPAHHVVRVTETTT